MLCRPVCLTNLTQAFDVFLSSGNRKTCFLSCLERGLHASGMTSLCLLSLSEVRRELPQDLLLLPNPPGSVTLLLLAEFQDSAPPPPGGPHLEDSALPPPGDLHLVHPPPAGLHLDLSEQDCLPAAVLLPVVVPMGPVVPRDLPPVAVQDAP